MVLEKKNFIFDAELTIKAKGLLSTMLYLEEHGTIDKKSILELCNEGITSIDNGLKELKELGYITPFKKGRGQKIQYIINHDKL